MARAAPKGAPTLSQLQAVLQEEEQRAVTELVSLDEEMAVLAEALEGVRDRIDDAEVIRRHVLRDHARFTAGEVEAALSRAGALRTEVALARLRLAGGLSRVAELRDWHRLLRELGQHLDDHRPPDGTLAEGLARYRSASRQVFQIIEEERARIARDMHDGPAQGLANLVLQAEILERQLDREPERAREDVRGFKDGVRAVLEETRRLVFDLRPLTLDDLGLVPTLRRLGLEYRDRYQLEIRISVLGSERRLPTRTEAALFRIISEALTNARRHANAKLVEVILNLQPHRVSAVVKDDGEGFERATVEARLATEPHLGLISMRERADLEHGRAEIVSQVGRGTEVRVTLPLP
ncbi:MAG TPA: sensor histidine kinase [Candidatus Micrarchaeia archaeon]|nr:sensor histidine kinase [Candidatus Micrarchaeia archaeon]